MLQHPAKYSRPLLPTINEWLAELSGPMLDPLAGVGSSGIPNLIHGELELEWLKQCPEPRLLADATKMPFASGSIGVVVCSPVYGNRMSDHHNARDKSKRITYRHTLGRELHTNNAGRLNWGKKYRKLHEQIWLETRRVLRKSDNPWECGWLLLNISDHYRRGEIVEVSAWHYRFLISNGFELVREQQIKTPRNGFGANGKLRVDHENLFLFQVNNT